MQGGGEVQALLTALAVHIIEGATGNAIVQALVVSHSPSPSQSSPSATLLQSGKLAFAGHSEVGIAVRQMPQLAPASQTGPLPPPPV